MFRIWYLNPYQAFKLCVCDLVDDEQLYWACNTLDTLLIDWDHIPAYASEVVDCASS